MGKPLIIANNIKFSHGRQTIAKDFSLSISAGDRIGLVGTNGCGKSTILKILNKTLLPDSGCVTAKHGLVISTVDQFIPDNLLSKDICSIILERIPRACHESERYKAEILLENLGFMEKDWAGTINRLSGGQVNLVLLARALICDPDLILMDEPSNHLDIESILILENFLMTNFRNSFALVSHDEELLNKVTNKTVFIKDGKAFSYQEPYSIAREKFSELKETLQKRRESEEKEIERLSVSAKRLAQWGKTYDNESFSKRAKSMEKRIEKLDASKSITLQPEKYMLAVDSKISRPASVLSVRNYQVRTPDNGRILYTIEKFHIKRGDRVILFGPNGSGKSTLLKNIVAFQNSQTEPTFRFNPQITIGYYDQEINQVDKNLEIFEFFRSESDESNQNIRNLLIGAGFRYDELNRRIGNLSGGERARLAFIKLSLQKPNFIVLDEPTNHIDLYGRRELLDQLQSSHATILLVSHDRKFCQEIGTRFVELRDGLMREISGPEEFYASPGPKSREPLAGKASKGKMSQKPTVASDLSENFIIDQITALEGLLWEDKKKEIPRQNLSQQQKWEEKIAEYYLHLDNF